MAESILDTIKGPIFIVGCPRSGTSMLVRILASHDQIRLLWGESSFYQSVYGNRRVYGGIGTPKCQAHLRAYLDRQKRAKRPWEALEFTQWMQTFEEIMGANYMDLYLALMLTFAESGFYGEGQWQYVGDKNPSDLYHVGHFLSYFPNAKIINIVRDSRAVVSSMLRSGLGYNSVIEAALTWRHYMRFSRRLGERVSSERYWRIRYEELVGAPAEVLKNTCRFLGLPADEGMLTADLSGLSSFRDPHERGFDPKRIARYETELTREDIALVEYIDKEEMSRWGYSAEGSVADVSVSVGTKLRIRLRSAILMVRSLASRWGVLLGCSGLLGRLRAVCYTILKGR